MLRVYRALFLAGLQAAWAAAAASQGGSIGDFEVGDFAAYYVAFTLVGQLTMAWNAYDFEYEVRNGRLSPKLLRPLHPLHYQIVDNVIWKIVTLLSLLPGGLQQAAYLLPFGYMLGAPAEILRGGPDPTAALALVAGQAVWLGVIWLVFVLLWRAGLRQFSAVGALPPQRSW